MSESKKACGGGLNSIWRFASRQGVPACVTRDGVITHSNSAFEELAGHGSGRLCNERDFAAGLTEFFIEHDKLIPSCGTAVRLLDVRGWPIGVRVMIVSRSKVGRCVLTQFIDFTQISQAIQRAIVKRRTLPDQLDSLTDSELTVLFFALRGYSAKRTAQRVNRSRRTVEHTIERIKRKLGAVNRSDLFEIAVARGYYALIPSHVFDEPTTIRLR